MVTVIDYGVGNLFSLKSSLAYIGEDVLVTGDYGAIKAADKIILPGVGAFRDAADKLKQRGLDVLIVEKAAEGTPIMGICLGMQMLFDESKEFGLYKGLSLIDGSVEPIKDIIGDGLKIPHIGWNPLIIKDKNHPIFQGVEGGDCVYFVHSFYAKAKKGDTVIATAEYGAELTAAVAKDNVIGCQFHPEKSGKVGLKILKNFCKI